MNTRLDGGILRGKTVGVKSNGEQNVVSLHPSLAGYYFQTGIGLDVTNVHTGTAGIRELHQTVKFRFAVIFGCVENAFVFPSVLPFLFNGLKIVLHAVSSVYLKKS